MYGADDRRDLWQTDADARQRAADSAIALVAPRQLRFGSVGDSSEVGVRAAPLSAHGDFCAGTPFLEQPTAASCSGVLIDDDLVLTAGHCLEAVPSCRDYFFARHYAYSEPDRLDFGKRADVYGCRAIAALQASAPDDPEQVDFAIVQLDRAVPMAAPAPVGSEAELAMGTELSVVGFPSGLPAKIDQGARVANARAGTLDFFTLSSDTFAASSGSAVADAAGVLVGVFARGTADYVDGPTCRSLRRQGEVPDDPTEAESATYAFRAIEALCESGWPTVRLCGIEPGCGDGVCSAAENPSSCADDCPTPSCGDGLCETPEIGDCPADCGDRRPAEIPDAWFCENEWFADGITCDCGCGTEDLDCTLAGRQGPCESFGPEAMPPPPEYPSDHSGCAFALLPASAARNEEALLRLALFMLVSGTLLRSCRRYERRIQRTAIS